MLSAIAGPDDRAPISVPVEPERWLDAARRPDVAGWRAAWSPDLGVSPVDQEVAQVAGAAARASWKVGPNFRQDGTLAKSRAWTSTRTTTYGSSATGHTR